LAANLSELGNESVPIQQSERWDVDLLFPSRLLLHSNSESHIKLPMAAHDKILHTTLPIVMINLMNRCFHKPRGKLLQGDT